ncbi:integumentary mucin C.1-like [Oppia nitens]|uniref:integumentary mucin C.1-like n=1 Tax=Oppia nitens TaxID=1686743 RepID=UPI0023DB291A|nr:integumentary mucin C.1-like [Oppia nitens]
MMNSKSTIGGTVLVWPSAVLILLVVMFSDHHIGGGGGGQVAALQGVQCPPKPDDNSESTITINSYKCRLEKWDEKDVDSDQTKRLRRCCSGIDELLMRYQLIYRLCTITSESAINGSFNSLIKVRLTNCKDNYQIDYDKSVCDRQPVYLDSDSCRYVIEKLADKSSTTTTTTTTTTVPTTVVNTVTTSSSSPSSATDSSDGSIDDTTTTTAPITTNTVDTVGDGTVSTVVVVVELTSEEITGFNMSTSSSSSDGRPDTINGTTILATKLTTTTPMTSSTSKLSLLWILLIPIVILVVCIVGFIVIVWIVNNRIRRQQHYSVGRQTRTVGSPVDANR